MSSRVMTRSEVATRIDGITETQDGCTYNQWGSADRATRDAIMASMAEHGWVEPPIVVDGENAFTGFDHIAARDELWNEQRISVSIPYIEVTDLCEEFGLDWAAILDEHSSLIREVDDEPELREYDVEAAVIAMGQRLPAEVADYLGLG